MTPTLADFRLYLPQFTDTPDATVERALLIVQEIHSRSKLAAVYCAAHILTLEADDTDQPDGGHGEISSETIGPSETTYVTQAEQGREAFFTTTLYGRTFLTLEKRNPEHAFSARV